MKAQGWFALAGLAAGAASRAHGESYEVAAWVAVSAGCAMLVARAIAKALAAMDGPGPE